MLRNLGANLVGYLIKKLTFTNRQSFELQLLKGQKVLKMSDSIFDGFAHRPGITLLAALHYLLYESLKSLIFEFEGQSEPGDIIFEGF